MIDRLFKPIRTIAAVIAGIVVLTSKTHAIDDIDRLYIINGLGETLTLVDRAGDSVVTNLMPLGGCPNRIRAVDSLLLVVNSCTDDLMVIRQPEHTIARTIEFPSGDNPWDVIVLDDSLCAVSFLVANEVGIVNYQTGAMRPRFTVGTSPEGLLYAYGRLFVANTGLDFGTFEYGQGTISVTHTDLSGVQLTIPVGTNPQIVTVAPDLTIHALCTGNYFDRFGIVYVIEADTLTVEDSIPVGGSPGDLVIAGDAIAYIAAGGFVDSGEVYRYDARTRTVLNGSANPWHTARGVLSVQNRLEGGVYALAFSADSVTELGSGGALAKTWEVGDGPGYTALVTNRSPGDLNDDGVKDIVDVVSMVNVAFRGGAPPERPNSADVNADCQYDVVDVVSIVNEVFRGGFPLYWGCAQ